MTTPKPEPKPLSVPEQLAERRRLDRLRYIHAQRPAPEPEKEKP